MIWKLDAHKLQDDDQEAVVMPNSNGENFLCYLPKVEKAKSGKPVAQHNTTGMIVETEKRVKLKTPDELLEEHKGQCFVRVRSLTPKSECIIFNKYYFASLLCVVF